MNPKPYKIIFVLLSTSLLAILLIQGFWLRNFYVQKLDEFNKTVYQTLSDVSAKLNERENINFIKESAFPQTKTRITKKDGTVKVIVSSSTSSDHRINDIAVLKELKMDSIFENNGQIVISDSVVRIDKNNHQTVIVKNKLSKSVPAKEDINKLLDKMLTEIQTIDVSPIDDINEDTLNGLIKRELGTKGIFTSFDFLLKKESKETDQILAKSKGFELNGKTYKADLSKNKVFRDHNFLYLQFPEEAGFVFSGIKNMLFLSVFFSLMMILVFYFTLKTILKQKKMSEIKNDFINNMTHELKTPIATISLAIDALNNPQTKHNEEKFNLYTSILKEENQKLNNHVERVLQMALLDKSELELHKKPLNVIELINTVVAAHQLQIKKQNAQIIFDVQQTEPKIKADEFHLLSAFNNLLDNALKYSKKNCVIEISVKNISGYLNVVFRDNGIGIEAAMQDKIFEKFFRAQGGNLHDVKGFGLGLSYVRSIIESHRGTIAVKSEKGKGSEFIIKLPINES
ncbi:MAG: HAMP domain-containing sensor histidine kinase [Bacteroidota bacterium]